MNFVDPSGLNPVSPDTRWGGADSFGHFVSQFHDSGYNIYYIALVIGVETTRAYYGGCTSIYLGGRRSDDADTGGGPQNPRILPNLMAASRTFCLSSIAMIGQS